MGAVDVDAESEGVVVRGNDAWDCEGAAALVGTALSLPTAGEGFGGGAVVVLVLVLIANRVTAELDRARVLSDNDSPMERDLRMLLEYVETGLVLLLLSLSASALVVVIVPS